MTHEEIKAQLLASYDTDGGINHLDGVNLPAQDTVVELARAYMHLLFPGFFEAQALEKKDVPAHVEALLRKLEDGLATELEKSLRFARDPDPGPRAREITAATLSRLPELRKLVQTDVMAAYEGDPAAGSVEEIILAYPAVLVISLQRLAHVLYRMGVPLLPRMITEYGHERTGCDIHPGAQLGAYFFVDHGTGVVIGETARVGEHVKLYQNVTLGAKSFVSDEKGLPVKGGRRHPTLEDRVVVYAGATILGGDTVIGTGSVVGSNVSLIESIPPNSIAYYRPDAAMVVRPRKPSDPMLAQRGVDWVI